MRKKVCLDPGHGVETAGKRSPDGTYREYEFALDMAYRIKSLLEPHGVEVILTRWDDHDITLANRAKIANAIKDLDLFVSLHSNAAGSGAKWMTARGLLVYAYITGGNSTRAAQYILDRQAQAGVKVRNNGKPVDGSNLYVIRKTTAPAVLVEHLFHDNEADTALLKDGAYRQLMAEADAKGILDYLGIAQKENNEEEDDMADMEEIKKVAREAAREEAQAVVRKEKASETFDTLLDVPDSYQAVLSKLMDVGALRGYDGGADGLLATPEDNTIRVDVTLCRVMTILSRPEALEALMALANGEAARIYNTVEECPEWSREAVAWAVDNGYIEGDGTGKLQLNAFKVWVLQVEFNKFKADVGA